MIAVAVTLILLPLQARGDDATQLLKRSKAATALVILPAERGSGSGFCVDASGLFITNAHVVKSVGATEVVTLILSPGEADEAVSHAKVVATDEELDLAILQSTDGKDLAALSLGTVQDLTETQQLTALGYPFGSALSAKSGKYPNISVNVLRISSLRKSGGELEAIQLDSQLNPGNSGGPVVDAAGRVVGVVSSGIVGGGINFAIPVSVLSKFLGTPRIVFTTPDIPEDKRRAPYDLTVKVVSFDKDKTPLKMQVVLNSGTSQEQTVTAAPAGAGLYQAHVVPNTSKDAAKLRVAITLPDGLIRSAIDDVAVRLDDRDYKLSALSQLERTSSKASITLRDGSEVTGKSISIVGVKAIIAGQAVPIDGTKIQKLVVFASADDIANPQYKIIVQRGEKVLVEQGGAFGEVTATVREAEPTTRENDAILSRLDDAKDEFNRSATEAKQRFLDVIESRTQAAANKGDLDAVKALEAAKQMAEHEGKLPETIKDSALLGAQATCIAAVKSAKGKLARAYDDAIRAYTRARKTSNAEAIKEELTQSGLTSEGEGNSPAEGWIQLGGKSKIPSFLQANDGVYTDKEGLRFNGRKYIKSRDGKYLSRDFTLDLVYAFHKQGDNHGILFIGMGEVALGPYDEPANSVGLRIHPPGVANGNVGIWKGPGTEDGLGDVREPGTHMVRIEKKGDTVTFSFCMNYEGKFTPDFTKTIPDIRAYAPFLGEKTTYLCFGGGATFQRIRLTVSQK